MLSSTSLAVLASLASAYVQARPIPQSVTMFRRAIMDVNAGTLIVPNIDTPASYAPKALEPYDQFHFRYTAIGCDDVDKGAPFFNDCCAPRPKNKLDDSNYPLACNLPAYLIYNPVYYDDKVVAQLGREGDAPAVSSSSVKTSSSSSSSPAEESSSTASSTYIWTPTSSSTSSSLSSSSTPAAVTSSKASSSSSSSSYSSPQSPAPAVEAPARNAVAKPWTSESSTWSSSEPAWTPSSSSSTPAWTPSSSAQWTPTTSSPAWTPEPSTQAAPSPKVLAAPQSNVFSGGQATYFYQGGNAGACGWVSQDSDKIVAIQVAQYGNTGVPSPHCGQTVTITNTNTGATVVATVADACPSCQGNPNSLDLSVGAFQALGDLSLGMIPITWHFN